MTDEAQEAPDSTELIVALVAAVGTDVGLVGDVISAQLATYDYTSSIHRLSDYLAEYLGLDFRSKPFDESLWEAMSAGDKLREEWQRGDALALHAVSDIVAERSQRADEAGLADVEGSTPNLPRHAFILRSLKTPEELETLRAIYGPRLVVIAAYSPRDARERHLAHLIEDSRSTPDRASWEYQPAELIDRDEKEGVRRGQDVSGTFHRADFFVRGWDRDVIRADIIRTLGILFGSPFCTPTRDEHAMFMAAGAALRSAEYGRQVGACIATRDGSVVALGTNEVPAPGGGSPWEEDALCIRDFEVSDLDTNRRHFDELAERLAGEVDTQLGALIEEIPLGTDGGNDAREAMDAVRKRFVELVPAGLRRGGLKDLTEFGRAVHAEMNALLDAARRGVPVADTILYSTTFPCHNCARHLIGAGVARVVFVEPYPKSRAADLHPDAVRVELSAEGDDDRIPFDPFVGVAPRRFLEMFDAAQRERLGHVGRKDAAGQRVAFKTGELSPVFVDGGLGPYRPEFREYRARETLALHHFDKHDGGGG